MTKWRIQREWFGLRMFHPATPVWMVYPPEGCKHAFIGRGPVLFSSWREAINFVSAESRITQ